MEQDGKHQCSPRKDKPWFSSVQAYISYCASQCVFLQLEGETLHQQKDYDLWKAQMTAVFLNSGVYIFRHDATAH